MLLNKSKSMSKLFVIKINNSKLTIDAIVYLIFQVRSVEPVRIRSMPHGKSKKIKLIKSGTKKVVKEKKPTQKSYNTF